MPGWQAGYALARSALPRMPRRYATLMPAAVIYPARPGSSARRSRVAQLAEHSAVNRRVIGSSPIAGAYALLGSLRSWLADALNGLAG